MSFSNCRLYYRGIEREIDGVRLAKNVDEDLVEFTRSPERFFLSFLSLTTYKVETQLRSERRLTCSQWSPPRPRFLAIFEEVRRVCVRHLKEAPTSTTLVPRGLFYQVAGYHHRGVFCMCVRASPSFTCAVGIEECFRLLCLYLKIHSPLSSPFTASPLWR